MIDLSKTLLVVMAYPDGHTDHRTLVYFMKRGLPIDKNVLALNLNCPVIQGRNTVIRDIVIPRLKVGFEWVIFIDKDNIPDDVYTNPFLDEVEADVVGCEYPLSNRGAWGIPEAFHMGLVRMRPAILQKVKPPWFMYEYNEDGTALKSCECGYLRNKLQAVGATITRRGWAEHDGNKQTWHASA